MYTHRSAAGFARRLKQNKDNISHSPPIASSSRHVFSTSSARQATHYETLAIPQNASKNQIKSSFYRLSKQFHPDVNKEPGAKEKFHQCNEAYSVLGDDRQRRSYDRTLSIPASGGSGVNTGQSNFHSHYAYEFRHRGATHAWEHPRRQRPPPGPNPSYTHQSSAHAYMHPNPQRGNPFASPHVRRATGHGGPPRTGWKKTEMDHAAQVSTFWRAMQVTGIVLVVSMIGGGWGASAA